MKDNYTGLHVTSKHRGQGQNNSKFYQTAELTERDFLKSDIYTVDGDGNFLQSVAGGQEHNFSFQEEQENKRPELSARAHRLGAKQEEDK